MLLILHNLPKEVTSLDVRQLIQQQCGMREVILDNLLDEGPGKRITVGLAEEEDAAMLMQKLNGLHYKKCQLFVEDVRKKKVTAPSNPLFIPAGLQPQAPKPWFQITAQKTAQTFPVNNSSMPYYMTQDTTSTNFGKPTQTTKLDSSIFNRNFQYPPNVMYQPPKNDNLWGYPVPVQGPNKVPAPNTNNNPPSFKSYQNDRDKRGDKRDSATQLDWRENKSPPSKRHENFGNLSQRDPRRVEDKNSEWSINTSGSKRRVDDRSPQRGRDSFRENKNDDRRDVFDRYRSRSSRLNPRDKDSYKNEGQNDRRQNNLFGRQRESVFDQHERRNDQKRIYDQMDRNTREHERPDKIFGNASKTSTTFSCNPENSFFSKPKSIFDKVIRPSGFVQTSKNKSQFSNPKQGTSVPEVTYSFPKRARFDLPPQRFDNKNVNPKGPFSVTTDYQKMMMRHTNWRVQSATLLGKEVLKNASCKPNSPIYKTVLKKLRECILSRIDVILGDKIAANLDEILRGYRAKFQYSDDCNFFKAVVEKIEREKIENADGVTDPNVCKETQQHQESEKLNPGPSLINPKWVSPIQENQKQHQESGKANKGFFNPYYSKPESTIKPKLGTGKLKDFTPPNKLLPPYIKNTTVQRLPRYPYSDKQGYKQIQKDSLSELEEGFYTMEPELDKAVNEEVEELVECYIQACEPCDNKEENNIRNKIITSTADEFKKIIKLHVTKRVLNVTEGLALRIFSTPKPPPKAALDAFLKQHGAISLKKSETTKMFVANCDSFESFDKLLALQTYNFGSVTIHIKPFQVMGPVTKQNKKANRTAPASAEQDFTKDVDELQIDLTNDLNDDQDVMLVEDEQSEVVVIRDDLDKSFSVVNTSGNVGENKDNVDIKNDHVCETDDLTVHSDEKADNVIIINDGTNNTVPIKDAASSERECNINDKVGASNVGADNISNRKVEHVDNKAAGENDSSDKVLNSESKESENVSESFDDILNEVDEIFEEDLEDF